MKKKFNHIYLYMKPQRDNKRKLDHPLTLFPNKPRFLRVSCTRPLKTLWEKEKLLVTSNFSFSHSFFYPSGELLPDSCNLKLSSAISFSMEESFVVLSKFVVLKRVKEFLCRQVQSNS